MKGEKMPRNTYSIANNPEMISVPGTFTSITNNNLLNGFESAYAGASSSAFGAYGGSIGGGTTITYSDQSVELANELEKEINTFYQESMTKYKQFIATLREEWVGDG